MTTGSDHSDITLISFVALAKLRSFNDLQHKSETSLDCVWNVMAHAHKPDFVLSAKRTSPFKWAGTSVQSTTGSRGVRISSSNAGYTMFRGSMKGTGYPLHSPVSPSLPLPCVTVCHHISTGLYKHRATWNAIDVCFFFALTKSFFKSCNSNKSDSFCHPELLHNAESVVCLIML